MSAQSPCALEAAAVEICRRRTAAPSWRVLGLEGAREAVETANRAQPAMHPRGPVQVEDIALAIDPDRVALPPRALRLPVRIYRPVGELGPLPALLYLHGAGWAFEPAASHDELARRLAASSHSVVLLPAYARAPEARHPIALEQCYQLLLAAAENGLHDRIAHSELAVVGDGTGGGIAAGLALLATGRGGPALSAQVLMCPALDPGCDTPSQQMFAGCTTLERDDVLWLWEQYVEDRDGPVDITAAPLRAEPHELSGLPRALVITAEVDVLRDEGERYASKLRQAGCEVVASRYLGTVHGFCHLAGLRETGAAQSLIEQVSWFLSRSAPATRAEQG